VDYENWTVDELQRLREYLATRGAGTEERDAVMRELRRRESTPQSAGVLAVPAGHTNANGERVGVGLRFVAVLIDGAIFFLIGFLLALVSGGTYTSSTGGTHSAGFHVGNKSFVVLALVGFVYYVCCEVLAGGTLGKRVLGLRVVDGRGNSIAWGAAIVRNVLRIVDGLFFYLVGAVAIWSSPDRQRLGDRAAHTYVVRT
jgi:uncharacterized RDD family membrane protein YckC